MLAGFNTFGKIFSKYNSNHLYQKELENIQQNLTIINYDTNDKELLNAHIDTLIGFVNFLQEDPSKGIISIQNLTILNKIFNFYFGIVKSEEASDDSRKSLQILQVI